MDVSVAYMFQIIHFLLATIDTVILGQVFYISVLSQTRQIQRIHGVVNSTSGVKRKTMEVRQTRHQTTQPYQWFNNTNSAVPLYQLSQVLSTRCCQLYSAGFAQLLCIDDISTGMKSMIFNPEVLSSWSITSGGELPLSLQAEISELRSRCIGGSGGIIATGTRSNIILVMYLS